MDIVAQTKNQNKRYLPHNLTTRIGAVKLYRQTHDIDFVVHRYGGVGKGLLVTLVDRKSRYLRMGLLRNRSAEETRKVIEELLAELPVHSVSLDNGSEFSEFRQLEKTLHTLVYFAEPHKPWQRGTNENTNDLVRFFFPKGFDFRTVTDEDVQLVQELLNNRPRKCLGWKTPLEVFFEKSVALA